MHNNIDFNHDFSCPVSDTDDTVKIIWPPSPDDILYPGIHPYSSTQQAPSDSLPGKMDTIIELLENIEAALIPKHNEDQ